MSKIVVTGASGFIGTNLLKYLVAKGHDVINIDISSPKDSKDTIFWRQINILDKDKLLRCVTDYAPDYIIHLAARTDLNGANEDDYIVNTVGTENIICIANLVSSIKKVIFASSMLVCEFGYVPNDQHEYKPSTFYGESKAEMERIIWNATHKYDWDIIRPTSIWGPWFDEPYIDFFKMILRKRYIHIGSKSAICTYGYVGNTVAQIEKLLFSDTHNNAEKVYYMGDYQPNNLEEWANEIASQVPYKIIRVPYVVVRMAALLGDILHKVNVPFPLTSFRLNNMTKNYILNLSNTQNIIPQLPYSRRTGVIDTVEWMKKNNKI